MCATCSTRSTADRATRLAIRRARIWRTRRRSFALLKPEEKINVRLTEGYHIEPEQSTNALVVHHPQAKYFVA